MRYQNKTLETREEERGLFLRGIFQASWSSAVNFRGGDRSMGGGGLGGPLDNTRQLNVKEIYAKVYPPRYFAMAKFRRFQRVFSPLYYLHNPILLLRIVPHLVGWLIPDIRGLSFCICVGKILWVLGSDSGTDKRG